MTFFGKLWRGILGVKPKEQAIVQSSGPSDSTLVAPKTSPLVSSTTTTLTPTFLDRLKDAALGILNSVSNGVQRVADQGLTVNTVNKVDPLSIVLLVGSVVGGIMLIKKIFSSKKVSYGR